jgi:hypothetical protein
MPDPKHGGIRSSGTRLSTTSAWASGATPSTWARPAFRLLYMDGQRMKKHNPARPYDRYVMYNGITMTGVMIAKQLNTSGVYDIA